MSTAPQPAHDVNPYVGARPFERADQAIFFGREAEISDLLCLVVAHQVVLVYAQSGTGKTSLIQAGLVPQLETEGFEVLPIARVRGMVPPQLEPQIGNIFAFNALASWAGEDADLRPLAATTFVQYLRRRVSASDEEDEAKPCVLIFDQFEELFSSYPDRWRDREDFFRQIGEVVAKERRLRVLFVMREDYIAQMDPYVGLLPDKLRIHFRMELLRKPAALSSVTEPLRSVKSGRTFAAGVAEKLVDNLLRVRVLRDAGEPVEIQGEFVEPVQLQLVCDRLWQDLPPQEQIITENHLQTFGDVNEALGEFYERSVARAVEASQIKEGALRAWFGDTLITTAGTRGVVFRGKTSTGGIPNEAVDTLENQHIIRGEYRAGARWYELAHDRLIEPIQRSNRRWRARLSTAYEISQRLRSQAAAWIEGGRTEEGLLDEGQLAEAERWMLTPDAAQIGIDDSVAAFVAASQAARERVQQERQLAVERARAEANQLAVKRLKRRAVWLTVASTAAVVMFVVAAVKWNQSEDYFRLATSRELASSAVASSTVDPDLATLLALYAVGKHSPVLEEVENALHQAVSAPRRTRLILAGHSDAVIEIAFSPDGKQVATASKDGTAKVWETASGHVLFLLSGHTSLVNSVAFSPNGKWIATASDDHTARIYDAASGQFLRALTGHTNEVWSVAFSPDQSSSLVVTAGRDQTARVWDVTSGKTIRTFAGHKGPVRRAIFSSDGKLLATASYDGTAKIWDASSGRQLKQLVGHQSRVTGIAFNPTGKMVATSSADGTAKLWDVASGYESFTMTGHSDWVQSITFSSDGQRIATASNDGTAKVWDAGSGREELTLVGHTAPVWSVAISPDGKLFATASGDKTARIWDESPGREYLTLIGHTAKVLGVTYSHDPDGSRIASASSDGTAMIWDTHTGQPVAVISAHASEVTAVDLSRDGKYLATTGRDGTAKVWDAHTGQNLATLSDHSEEAWGVVFSPDAKRVVSAHSDQTAKVWDWQSGKLILNLVGHKERVFGVAYSQDGKWIATASQDNTAKLWDAASGKERRTFRLDGEVWGVAFSPDSRQLVTAGWDRKAVIWDLASGNQLLNLVGHEGAVRRVAFSPDGSRVATAGADETARLWDASSGRQLLTLSGQSGAVYDVDVSPDGKHLAAAGFDKLIRVYSLDLQELVQIARDRLTRGMTERECEKYLHTKPCPAEPLAGKVAARPRNP